MPRHQKRSHLVAPGGRSYCGKSSRDVEVLAHNEWAQTDNQCAVCARIFRGKSEDKKETPIKMIAIRPSPEVRSYLDNLAKDGKLGDWVLEAIELTIENNADRIPQAELTERNLGTIELHPQPLTEWGDREDHADAEIRFDARGRERLIEALIEGRDAIEFYGESGGEYRLGLVLEDK